MPNLNDVNFTATTIFPCGQLIMKKKIPELQKTRNNSDVYVTEKEKASQLCLIFFHVNSCLYHHQNPWSHLLKFYRLEILLETAEKNKVA